MVVTDIGARVLESAPRQVMRWVSHQSQSEGLVLTYRHRPGFTMAFELTWPPTTRMETLLGIDRHFSHYLAYGSFFFRWFGDDNRWSGRCIYSRAPAFEYRPAHGSASVIIEETLADDHT